MSKIREKTTATLLIAIFILSIFAVLMPVSAAEPTTYYVATTGNNDVNDGSEGFPWLTIQYAINNVDIGDIIIVHSGTYAEDLVIDESIELMAALGDTVTIKGVIKTEIALFPLAEANIEILADDVKIHGFTIESPDVLTDEYSSGMVLTGTNIEIYDNYFVSIGGGSCIVIQAYSSNVMPLSDISGLNIHHNEFSGTPTEGYDGVYVNPTLVGTDYVTISDNDFIGIIHQSIITERSYTKILDNTMISDQVNTIYGNGIGVYQFGGGTQSDVLVSGNLIKGSGPGLGFNRGIFTGVGTQTQTNIVITGNTVEGNNYGVLVRNTPLEVTVNYNDILNNVMNVENTASGTLDATHNWWGTADPVQIEAKISGLVTYDPWLSDEYGEGGPVSMDPLGLSGTARFPTVSLTIDGTGDFPDVITGIPTPAMDILVTNTGEITVDITTMVIEDIKFYTDYLRIAFIDGGASVLPAGMLIEGLYGTGYETSGGDFTYLWLSLEVPLGYEIGIYTGTLFFIAEAVTEIS